MYPVVFPQGQRGRARGLRHGGLMSLYLIVAYSTTGYTVIIRTFVHNDIRYSS